MQRVTITIDDELDAELARFMTARGYANRSEAIRDLARSGLQQAASEVGGPRPCVAALIYIYDHEARDLPQAPHPRLSSPPRPRASDAAHASRSRQLHGSDRAQRPWLRRAGICRPYHRRTRRAAWPCRVLAGRRPARSRSKERTSRDAQSCACPQPSPPRRLPAATFKIIDCLR